MTTQMRAAESGPRKTLCSNQNKIFKEKEKNGNKGGTGRVKIT